MGHRIIEINGQSVVATPHEKIIQILTQAVSEVSWVTARAPVLWGSCSCTQSRLGSVFLQPFGISQLICASLPRSTSRPCRPPRTAY